jgi:hypothetical protein
MDIFEKIKTIIIISAIVVAIFFPIIKIAGIKRKRYCPTCKKYFQNDLDYCPDCGERDIKILNADSSTINMSGDDSTMVRDLWIFVFA